MISDLSAIDVLLVEVDSSFLNDGIAGEEPAELGDVVAEAEEVEAGEFVVADVAVASGEPKVRPTKGAVHDDFIPIGIILGS